MSDFRAIVIEQQLVDGRITDHSAQLRTVDDSILMPGDVTVAVEFSSVNFKDGLAIAGKPGVVKSSPLIPGIDLVGIVETSNHPRWVAGDRVILNGAGIGETHHGGLAERARVDGDQLVRVPAGLTAEQAAAIGTAGFTAMLSVLALERQGITADAGEILVTGAAGGVGSVATAVLARLGYAVTASSGRVREQGEYLRTLGANEVIDRTELAEPGKPLQRKRWAAVVDCVGSHTLANALAQTQYGGTVTACGLAQGPDLPATVLPFILRAVTLVGINSVDAPRALREQAWARLEEDLDLGLFAQLTQTIPLAEVIAAATDILAGHVRGRLAVNVSA